MWLKHTFAQQKIPYLLGVVLFVSVLDQLAKFLSNNLRDNPVSLGWLELIWYENPGIAFSIDLPRSIAVILAALTLIVLFWLYWRASLSANFYRLGLLLIIAGGISNLFDKITLGYVIDMVSITFLPVFNIADIAILAGIILIIIEWSRESTTQI